MEDIDEHLFISYIEISCWKDQLKQVVSQSFIITTFFNEFHFRIKSILFEILFQLLSNFFGGFAETILMPLQTSSVLMKVDLKKSSS